MFIVQVRICKQVDNAQFVFLSYVNVMIAFRLDRSVNVPNRSTPSATLLNTRNTPSFSERQSRRDHRVATSLSHSINQTTNRLSPILRGKTPLI
jgi:hypothetical protein